MLCLLLVRTLGFAQLSIDGQTEIMLDRHEQNFELISLGKQGLLVFVDNTNLQGIQAQMTVTKYDTLLAEQWKQTYPIGFEISKQLHSVSDGNLYFLANTEKAVYQILSLNLTNGDMNIISCANTLDLYTIDFNISQFVSVIDGFVFGGMLKEKPTILHYDMQLARFKVLPNINYLKANLVSIAADESAQLFSVLLASKGNFYYNNYTHKGNLLGNSEVKPENKKYNFYSFQQYIKNKNEQFVIGTYSFFLPQPQGIYVAKFVNNKYANTQYYSFNDFQNFYNHLDSAKREKIRAKIQGNSAYRNDYEIEEQNLAIFDNRIVYVLKASKPRYTASYEVEKEASTSSGLKIGKYTYQKTEVYATPPNITNTDNVNRNNRSNRASQPPTASDTKVEPSQFGQKNSVRKNIPPIKIQGYIYKNVITCTLDKKGEILWDNAFDFRNIEDYQSENTIQVVANNNHLTLLQSINQKVYFSNADNNKSSKDTYVLNSPVVNLGGLEQKQKIIPWYESQFIFIGLTYNSMELTGQPKLKLLKVHSTD